LRLVSDFQGFDEKRYKPLERSLLASEEKDRWRGTNQADPRFASPMAAGHKTRFVIASIDFSRCQRCVVGCCESVQYEPEPPSARLFACFQYADVRETLTVIAPQGVKARGSP